MNDIELTDEIREEIVTLAGAMREDTIEDIDIVRLDQLLCECPGAVGLYTDLALITSDLKDLSGHQFASPVEKNKKKRTLNFPTLLAVAAIITLAFFFSFTKKSPDRGNDIASISAVFGTDFAYGGIDGKELTAGEQIQSGYYQLRKGILELKYKNGAAVIIEGPANFHLKDEMQVNLESGNLSANIPETAKGFTVLTNAAKVVDLGTEFSVKASEFESEVHVFKGEVVVEPTKSNNTSESLHLFENQASKIGINSSSPVGIDVNPDEFLRNLDEPRHLYPNMIRSLKPVAYYRMRPTQDETLEDKLDKHNGRYMHDYSSRKPAWGPGRFGASLRCEGPGINRYAKVEDFPVNDNDRFTVTAWILAESRPRKATIVKIGGSDDRGLFSFGLYRKTGELRGNIGSITGKLINVKSKKPIILNQWMHVALVADGSKLKLYVNGKLEADSSYTSTDFDPLIKTLSIGAVPDKKGGARSNWDGRIDELAIFDYALDGSTIYKIYSIQPGKLLSSESLSD